MFKLNVKNGILYASDQTGTRFQGFGGASGNYHGLDFALFYMDIRENAILKAKTLKKLILINVLHNSRSNLEWIGFKKF